MANDSFERQRSVRIRQILKRYKQFNFELLIPPYHMALNWLRLSTKCSIQFLCKRKTFILMNICASWRQTLEKLKTYRIHIIPIHNPNLVFLRVTNNKGFTAKAKHSTMEIAKNIILNIWCYAHTITNIQFTWIGKNANLRWKSTLFPRFKQTNKFPLFPNRVVWFRYFSFFQKTINSILMGSNLNHSHKMGNVLLF